MTGSVALGGVGGFLVARPPTAQRGTLGHSASGRCRACSVVVAETLTRCGCSFEYPSNVWVQALDGGKREKV